MVFAIECNFYYKTSRKQLYIDGLTGISTLQAYCTEQTIKLLPCSSLGPQTQVVQMYNNSSTLSLYSRQKGIKLHCNRSHLKNQ